jgi:5-formyltetrahydrofolate cyclo-ligase
MNSPSLDGSPSLDENKAALRKQNALIRAKAAAAAPESATDLARHADTLKSALLPREGMIVAGYWPIRSEIDPTPLLGELAQRGYQTALPATPQPDEALVFYLWQPGEALVDGPYGTSEPASTAPQCEPDCLLVPMLAFDDAFYRLGYGGGFYDRSLTVIRKSKPDASAVGIAYPEQKVERIPIGPHDARLDAVLTPHGLMRPQGEAG